MRFDPWVGKIPWRRAWQPTPVYLPGESHGQRSLAGWSMGRQRVRHNCRTLAHMSVSVYVHPEVRNCPKNVIYIYTHTHRNVFSHLKQAKDYDNTITVIRGFPHHSPFHPCDVRPGPIELLEFQPSLPSSRPTESGKGLKKMLTLPLSRIQGSITLHFAYISVAKM